MLYNKTVKRPYPLNAINLPSRWRKRRASAAILLRTKSRSKKFLEGAFLDVLASELCAVKICCDVGQAAGV